MFFDEYFNNFMNRTEDHTAEKDIKGALLMNTDIYETTEAYEFIMDLPGYRKEDIHVEMREGYLFVEAQKSKEEANAGKKCIRREIPAGTLERRFYLGEDVEEKEGRARFENGVLMLLIPKKKPVPEEDKSTRIPVL